VILTEIELLTLIAPVRTELEGMIEVMIIGGRLITDLSLITETTMVLFPEKIRVSAVMALSRVRIEAMITGERLITDLDQIVEDTLILGVPPVIIGVPMVMVIG